MDNTTTITTDADQVERLLLAEQAVRCAYVRAGFGADFDTRARGERDLAQAREEFWAIVGASNAPTLAEFTKRRMAIAA